MELYGLSGNSAPTAVIKQCCIQMTLATSAAMTVPICHLSEIGADWIAMKFLLCPPQDKMSYL